MMRIAIMQPYFFPYAGYYRLFAVADLFVVLDSVQFPRRGWVHRNRFRNEQGELDWMTLPLRKSPQSATIVEQQFRDDGDDTLRESVTRFPALRAADNDDALIRHLWGCEGALVPYLVTQLTAVRDWLGLSTPIQLASEIADPSDANGVDRLITIAKTCNATHYVNLSGGQALYDAADFARAGLTLEFLTEFNGDYASILERALTEPRAVIMTEITEQARIA